MREIEEARDYNDRLADLMASKESDPIQFSMGLDRMKADQQQRNIPSRPPMMQQTVMNEPYKRPRIE